MAEIVRPPQFENAGSGGGPEDPMLEARVARVEGDMKDVKASLKRIEAAVGAIKFLPTASDLTALRVGVAELKGRISQGPTFLQLVVVVITTWSAGAAMVAGLLRFAKP